MDYRDTPEEAIFRQEVHDFIQKESPRNVMRGEGGYGGQGDAWKAWKALKPGEELVAVILAAVECAKASVQWRKDEGQFIPYPASWLRARGFEDEEHVDVVPLPHTRGEKGRIASSVAALQTLFGANDGKANDGKADLPAGNGVPCRRLRG